mmetsp:Transcript_6584/g.12412  ORF Transcript_6584/g.12412 Transcript_6584/m.12412 type:complete len:309 (-) Transcript_6584:259-1185(-)
MQKADNHPTATASHWVPKANSTAIDIGFGPVHLQILFACNVLGGKCFMQLGKIVIINLCALGSHQVLHSCYRAATHDLRCTATHSHTCDGRQGLHAQFIRLLARHEQYGRSTIIDARGVARSDSASFGNKSPRKGLKFFDFEVLPEMLICCNSNLLLLFLVSNGHNFSLKTTLRCSSLNTAVASQGQLVLLFSGNAILSSHKLSGQPHDVWFATEFLLRAIQRVRNVVGAHVQPAGQSIVTCPILQPCAPTCTRKDVGCTAHVFHSTNHDTVLKTRPDGDGSVLQARHSRSAHPIYRYCRGCVRDARH